MKAVGLIIASIFAFSTLMAQDQDEKPKKIGIRAGYHLATMVENGSKPDDGKNLSSYFVGVFQEQKIAPILHFGKGIEYFQNGIKYKDNSKRILHTISIPLDLKVKLGPVYALGGAATNFKVSEKFTLGNNYVDPYENDKSSWFDIAAFAGAGVKILFLSVEARYHWGLIKARDKGLYNRYFQLGGSFSF